MKQKFLPLLVLGAISLHAQSQSNHSNFYRINLQSSSGLFLSATRGVPPSIKAIVERPNLDEFYVLEDENGGPLESGDPIRLYAHSGYVAANESSNEIVAAGSPEQELELKIVRDDGGGTIRNHDKINLVTQDGLYFTETSKNTFKLNSNGSGKSLTIAVADVDLAIAERFAQDWKAGWGITFDNSPQGMAGKKLQTPSSLTSLASFAGGHNVNSSSAMNSNTNNSSIAKPQTTSATVKNTTSSPVKSTTATPSPVKGLPSSLPLGYYKCYVDHVSNLAMAGYFTVLAGNKYIFHGFDSNKRTGPEGQFSYDSKTGKVIWLSGSWKANNYYGLYSLDATYGDRLYLIPNGSDYSACKCFLQK